MDEITKKIKVKKRDIGIESISAYVNNKTNIAFVNTKCQNSSKIYVFNLRLDVPLHP